MSWKIIDFWKEWNNLAYLTLLKNVTSWSSIVRWGKWMKESKYNAYTKKLFGRNIRQTKTPKKALKSDLDNKDEFFDKLKWKEEVVSNLQWQIWFNYINLDINLQWDSWSKIFWFEWLIDWMLEKSSWPNWRTILTKTNIHSNKDWKKFIEILSKETDKSEDSFCKEHSKESTIYCTEWNWYIWSTWIIQKTHNNHSLIENEAILDMFNNKVEIELSENKSAVKLCQNAIKMIQNNQDISETILNDVVDSYIQSIIDISQELGTFIKNILNDWKEKLKVTLEKWKNNEEIMIDYQDSQNQMLIAQVFNSISKSNDLREETEKLIIDAVQQWRKKNYLLIDNKPIEIDLYCLVSDITQKDEINLKVDKYSESLSQFSIRRVDAADNETNSRFEVNLLFSQSFCSGCYLKLELEENKYWELEENQTKYFDWDQSPKQINNLILNSESCIYHSDSLLNFKLLIWKFEENISAYFEKIMYSILIKIGKAKSQECKKNINKISTFNSLNESSIKEDQDKIISNKSLFKKEVKNRNNKIEEEKSAKLIRNKRWVSKVNKSML